MYSRALTCAPVWTPTPLYRLPGREHWCCVRPCVWGLLKFLSSHYLSTAEDLGSQPGLFSEWLQIVLCFLVHVELLEQAPLLLLGTLSFMLLLLLLLEKSKSKVMNWFTVLLIFCAWCFSVIKSWHQQGFSSRGPSEADPEAHPSMLTDLRCLWSRVHISSRCAQALPRERFWNWDRLCMKPHLQTETMNRKRWFSVVFTQNQVKLCGSAEFWLEDRGGSLCVAGSHFSFHIPFGSISQTWNLGVKRGVGHE